MTSISSLSGLSSSGSSPFSNMIDEISAAVQAGVLSQTDATALDTALGSISDALSGSASSGASSPGDMKSKVDSLIAQQVSDGTLSQDQAKELQAFFAQGPGGGPPPASGQSGSDAAATAATTTSGTSDSTSTDQYDALVAFLKNLKAQNAQESGSYSIGQSSTASSGIAGTLFNTSA